MRKQTIGDAPSRLPAGAGPDVCTVLGRLAARLAADTDRDALADALGLLVEDLGLRSGVLRDAVDGEVLAVAGEVVHAVPAGRNRSAGPGAVVEIPVQAGGRPLACLTVIGARPAQLPALRAGAQVLGLALRPTPPHLPLALLEAEDAAAAAAADALHDGPVQELVVARYAADAALRGGDPHTVRDAVQASLMSLRRALWLQRPRGADSDGLAAALAQLSATLQEAGRPALLLDVDADACSRLTPQAASVCYRLVQLVAGRSGGCATGVRVHACHDTVRLELDGDLTALTLPAVAPRWRARARALGAALVLPDSTTPRVVLSVPVPARTDSPPHDQRRRP
jgi:hypothetical protein